MRFVVVGAGAIGGAVGGRLFERGFDVTLVARGEHGRALRSGGLVLESPDETVTLPIPVGHGPLGGVLGRGDTGRAARREGAGHRRTRSRSCVVAPPDAAVVCMQNGVENERRVLRHFPNTYGMCVMCPASQLRPGVVQVHSAPVSGLLDLGRFPSGLDDAGPGDRRRHRDHDVPVGGPARHHALEVPQAADEPGQRGGGAVRARGPVQPVGEGGAARGQGGAGRGGHRRGELRGGPGAAGRLPADRAHRRRGSGRGARAGRASPAGRGRSRPSSSTARSCCWERCTACRRRSTRCCSAWPPGPPPRVPPPGSWSVEELSELAGLPDGE